MPADRIRSLDTLRGLMLVIMAIDHLDLYGPVYRLTYETFGFVSAAEGFVLLSGIVAGLVYGGYAETPGRLAGAVRRRLATLYRYHLVLVAGLLGAWLVHADLRPAAGIAAPILAAAGGAVLLNQEPPLDILPLYLLFVASLPLVLTGFVRGRAPLVLCVSAGVWLLDQVLTGLPWYPVELRFTVAGVPVFWQPNHFHLLAWQFLFVAGAWVGWRARAGGVDRGVRQGARRSVVAVALVVAAACFALRHGVFVDEISRATASVARVNLGPLRLLDVAAAGVLVAAAASRLPSWFRNPWLELLGRHALLVFTWQTLIQVFLRPLYLDAADRWGMAARLAILVLVVASLAVPARWREASARSAVDMSSDKRRRR